MDRRVVYLLTCFNRTPGTFSSVTRLFMNREASLISYRNRRKFMHGIIYLVGLVVVVLAILSFLGLG